MTLERRRRPADEADTTQNDQPDEVQATSEEARRDASDRAAELLARLRKL